MSFAHINMISSLHAAVKKYLIYVSSVLVIACKEHYVSPYVSPNLGYLVVEGIINSGPGSTLIKLSRTTALSDSSRTVETGAQVFIEGNNSTNYTLTETAKGQYMIGGLTLDPNSKYRLRIVSNQKEYDSDFVPVNRNPPIDSISWAYRSDGVHIFANTHDPSNIAKYFQWDFTETWEIHSQYIPDILYNPNNRGEVIHFNGLFYYVHDSSKYQCWHSDTSQTILLGSTAKYSIDTISAPINLVEKGSVKMSVLYSINARQFALTKDAYEFLQKMQKNSTQLGTVFDAQPSELQGNIHSVSDPSEMVIGYVSICPIQEKRTFISNSDLPDWNYQSNCPIEIQTNGKFNNYAADGITTLLLPIEWLTLASHPYNGYIVTFTSAAVRCVDCTAVGTKSKPAFWP
ncbi:MAG: hypothetical protein C5B59_06110 [Bacteroidetes bacterium]|nr:MAG: hypothetical protein C5B59_06110 [Bacteroidota bacterium]